MKSLRELGGLVYSTDSGRMCPGCRQSVAQCQCASRRALPVGDGIARVQRETKGRGGKAVTVVRGLLLDAEALAALAKRIKAACGSGGTVKDGQVEVQGDHCDKVVAFLQAEGFKARRSGG
jgi:translation initiation factor 1